MPTLTILDVVLVAVMLISGLLAMLRGLTREVLSILAWVAAAGGAWYAYKNYQDVAREMIPINPPIVADIALAGFAFLVILIVVSLLTIKIGDRVIDSGVGALDRTLGLLFGFARGLILVAIAFVFFNWFIDDKTRPAWIEDAYSKSTVEWAGGKIQNIARDLSDRVNEELNKTRDR